MAYTAAVITVSDSCAAGTRTDTAGPALCELLRAAGWEIAHAATVPDEQDAIRASLLSCADERECDLILTTGGTGLSPRDVTPEATQSVLEREIPAVSQAMLYASLQITPRAMLSRAICGTRGKALILNLPGSEKGARENLLAVLDTLPHALEMMRGGGHD